MGKSSRFAGLAVGLVLWAGAQGSGAGDLVGVKRLGAERAELSHRLRRVLSTLDPKAQMQTLLQQGILSQSCIICLPSHE